MTNPEPHTLAEVNERVPELRQRFATVMQLRGQLKAIYGRLEEAGHPPGQRLPVHSAAELIRDRAVFDAMAEALREEVERIARTGCVIRDIETGLVDWLGRAGNRDVWLCWRYGEPEVAWFHEIEEGFGGRKPVAELHLPPPSTETPR
jgi:hypothetical protein